MKISSKGRYAVRAMVDIARNEQEYVSLNDIAIRQDISLKYLEAIVAKLVKSKLLISKHGVLGGYKLSKEPKDCTIAEILKVTDDMPELVWCLDKECPRKRNCDTVGCWNTLNNIISDYLNKVTLQDLIDKTYNK